MANPMWDFKYAARTLWKAPGFTVPAVLTLALGIGACTAMFSVVYNMLIAPFPYPDASRMMIVRLHNADHPQNPSRGGFTGAEFLYYSDNNRVFDRIIANSSEDVFYVTPGRTDRFRAKIVTPGTFDFLGLLALVGRTPVGDDYRAGAPPVFLLRYATWRTRFQADPSILNQTFVLNGTPRTLIGVMPPRFAFGNADIWIPQTPLPTTSTGDAWYMLGHLKPGVTVSEAEQDFQLLGQHLATLYPHAYPPRFSFEMLSLMDLVVGKFQSTLEVILAAVGLLLLIACANAANLFLARATVREREFAIRAALGSNRWSLVWQLFLEGIVVTICAAVAGVFLARLGLNALIAAVPPKLIPAEAEITLNGHVLVFALGVATVSALLFGLAPAQQAWRSNLRDSLLGAAKGNDGNWRRGRLRNSLVITEVALSFTLIAAAGLLGRSFVALRQIHSGFSTDHVLESQIAFPPNVYQTAAQTGGFFRALLARLNATPGIVSAAATTGIPPNGDFASEVEIPGRSDLKWQKALVRLCSDQYLGTLRIPLIAGRMFGPDEVANARHVLVINQTFAQTFFGNSDPIGQPVRLLSMSGLPDPVTDPTFKVVGVAGDAANASLQEPSQPEVWAPYMTTGSVGRGLLVRTEGDPIDSLRAIRSAVADTDPRVALVDPGTLDRFVDTLSYVQPRFGLLFMSIFAGVGFVLAGLGVFSVISYTTARRSHEIAIRMALGASSGNIMSLIVSGGLKLVGSGIIIGLAASFLLWGVLASQLWHVSAFDPVSWLGATALLILTGTAACCAPAYRTLRVNPSVTLRQDRS